MISFPFPLFDRPVPLREEAEKLLGSIRPENRSLRGQELWGENPARRRGPGAQFWQFRAYQQGDRPQDIDWRKSARSDSVYIREREQSSQRPLGLYLADTETMHFSSDRKLSTKYETGALLTLAFALWAERSYNSARFMNMPVRADNLETILADGNYGSHAFLPEFRKNETAVLCGDFIQPFEDLHDLFSRTGGNRAVLIQCLDPAELEFPFQGRAYFMEKPSGENHLANDAGAVRDEYLRNLQTHLDLIRDYAASRNWDYHLLRTDEDPSLLFSKALQYIGEDF